MNRLLVGALCLCILPGCGQAPSDLDQAEPALRNALEAWKSGSTQQDLESQKPSILMNEDDWREGRRLLDYKMEDTGVLQGRQVVCRVQIKLQDKTAKRRSAARKST